jgi:hypothetical protein
MALFEGKTPAERNKMIAAIALGAIAIFFVGRMLFGSSPPRPANPTSKAGRTTPRATQSPGAAGAQPDAVDETLVAPQEVVFERPLFDGTDVGRNIFAYYVRPAGTPSPSASVEPTLPPATPTPTPPLGLAGIAPQSVYARTSNFTLQVSGDKFTPATRVYVEGQEMPTQFKSPQQLTATVPASLISAPGSRQVIARTPDNQLYSNTATLNVMQPPVPTFTYVGFLSRKRYNTAVLRDQKGELYSVQANDTVERRFLVTEVSERGVALVDKELNIKHPLPLLDPRAVGGARVGAIPPPPPPKADDDDVEEEP